VEETINELVNGSIRIEDFPHIQVCIIDDMIFSSDNRRLYVFQEAIRRGLKVDKIPVRVRRSTDLNIKWKMEVLSFLEDKKNSNVQGFQNTSFLLKVEKFEDQDIQARMFFLDGDPVEELFSIPDEIEVKEINETKNRKID
ncbi:18664_t:CDS:2, partial [Racocetra persica]